MICAFVRRFLATVGCRGDNRLTRCILCGEKRRQMTAHLWVDHADGA